MEPCQRLVPAIVALVLVHSVCPSPVVAQPVLDSSQRILSGLESFRHDMVWPATLDLPAAWRDGFRSMAELQRKTGNEHGACLSVSPRARDMAETEELLRAYAKLRQQRSQLPASEFTRRERALRERIEAPLEASSTGTLAWQMGTPQSGNEMSVTLKENLSTCGGNYLGRVHTHPSGLAFSDTDAANVVRDESVKVSAVVVPDGLTCVAVQGLGKRESAYGPDPFEFGAAFASRAPVISYQEFKMAYQAQSLNVAYNQLEASARAQHRLPQDAAMQRERALLGAALSKIGGALYCGALSQPLMRVQPIGAADLIDEGSPQQAGLVLAAKAMIIMLNRLQSAPWKLPPVFPFTPELDADFLAYLRALQPSDSNDSNLVEALHREAGKPIAEVSPVRLFRLVAWMSDDNFPGLLVGGEGYLGLAMPDPRGVERPPPLEMQFMCRVRIEPAQADELFCAVAEVRDVQGKRILGGTAALYRISPATGKGTASHLFGDTATGLHRIIGPVPVSYRGQLLPAAAGTLGTSMPHGQGVMEWPTQTFSGSFERGLPRRGWLTDKATGSKREMEFENGRFRPVP